MADSLPKAIFLMGPTASGKTGLAMALQDRLPCELVSVDSALIYRDMNIGTAKPTPEELQQAPHALIDILDPSESYSVADFYHDAVAEMARITQAGKIPLLVGGTMMYFKVLREGIAALPSADPAIREKINADAAENGWPYVHNQLAHVDPESAARLKPNDAQRIQRALEVYLSSGKTLTEHWQIQKIAQKQAFERKATGKDENTRYTRGEGMLPPISYDIVSMAIAPQERAELHRRIALRFEQMLDHGFLNEVKALRERGDLDLSLPSMRCVGYRQAWEYLDGAYDYSLMKEKGIVATRQLAKRQLTWLRSWPDLEWLDTDDKNVIDKALKIIG